MKAGAPVFDSRLIREEGPVWLLCLAAFLAPLIGGSVPVEALPVEPGYAPMMRAIFGGLEAPMLSHFALAQLVCASTVWLLLTRRVIQIPMIWLSAPTLVFFGLVAASTVFSAFLAVAIPAALEWVVYGVALLATVAAIGRKRGPVRLAGSLFAGNLILALLAIWEYVALTNDPSWRVFGTWQNPNALAGMLLLGFFAGAGLTLYASRLSFAITAGVGTAGIGLAIALTQSKGAYLAAGAGLAVLFILIVAWLARQGSNGMIGLAKAAACLVLLIGLLALMRLKTSGEAGPGALSRVAQAEATQDQSSGFRTLLWKGTFELMRERPLGWGAGSYRYESARPGLTTQTHFAHNSFLQLGVEAGVLAPLALLAFGGVWFYFAFKGSRSQDPQSLALKAGVVAAVAASAAHSMVDSDLHYFGSGLAFFLLLGIGLQLNADGGTPESIQTGPRWTAFGVALALPLGLLYYGAVEATRSHMQWNLAKGQLRSAQEGARALSHIAGGDGEVHYSLAIFEVGMARIVPLQMAADRTPSTRILRALAREQSQAGDAVAAASTLHRALQRDPNNLFTLKLLHDVYVKSENHEMAEQTALRLIGVEAKPYFQTRALPELVPSETYSARFYLASRTDSAEKRIELLAPAFEGLLNYAARTAPNVAAAVREGMDQGFGGETAEDVRTKLTMAQEIAKKLAADYRTMNQLDNAEDVEKRSIAFGEATSKLG